MKNLRRMLREGQVVFGATMTEYARPSLIKLYKQAGFDEANEHTLVVAHIETQEGVDQIEAIAANPHVDVVLVGPFDLSISLGVPGQMLHSKMIEAMERIYAAARTNGHAPGYASAGLEDARYWLERGVQFFELPGELDMIRDAATEMAVRFRQAIADCGLRSKLHTLHLYHEGGRGNMG